MKKISKVVAVSLAAMTMSIGLAACKGGKGASEYVYDYTISDKKLTYTFYGSMNAFKNQEGDTVLPEIEKKFNVKIKLQSGGTDWRKKLATQMNSGKNIPDVFFSIPDETNLVNWIDNDCVVPLNGYLDKIEEETGTSALKNLLNTQQLKKSTVIDGTNYFLPQTTGISNHVLVVRKDWMKQWAQARGYAADYEPVGITQFTDMLSYFHTDIVVTDKSGNRQVVYGLGLNNNFDFTEGFLSAFGISPSYTKGADGTYKLSVFDEKYDNYVNWLKTGHDSGYIIKDFYSQTEADTSSAFTAQKIGAYICTNGGTYTNVEAVAEFQYENLGADAVTMINFPSSDPDASGNVQYAGSPVGDQYYYGGYSISYTAKEPYRLAKILDYIASEEGQTLLTWGIKDKHYSVDATGKKYISDENLNTRETECAIAFDMKQPVLVADETVLTDRRSDSLYALAGALFPMKCKVVDGQLVYDVEYSLLFRDGAEQKANDEYLVGLAKENKINWRLPTFLINDSKILQTSRECLDYAMNYTVNVASGQYTKEDQLSKLNTYLASKDIDAVYKYLQENDK